MTVQVEMMRGARLCVETCMGVRPQEKVLILTDQAYMDQAQSLAAAVYLFDADPMILTIPARRYYEKEPALPVAEAMRASDVVLITMPPLFAHFLYHTTARKAATKGGTRLANVWLSPENWDLTPAEVLETRRLSENIQGLLTQAKRARLRTPGGTDITFDLEGREAIMLSSLLTKPGESGAIPDYAEAAIAPVEGRAEGVFRVDASMLGVGLLREPMTLIVEKGQLVEIQGGEEKARLEELLGRADGNARNIAELGIGTVTRGKITGAVDDKRLFGTAHIAVGDNHTIGGVTQSNIHLDAVTLNVTLELDGRVVIEGGALKV